jgi:hypothetical protein
MEKMLDRLTVGNASDIAGHAPPGRRKVLRDFRIGDRCLAVLDEIPVFVVTD